MHRGHSRILSSVISHLSIPEQRAHLPLQHFGRRHLLHFKGGEGLVRDL